MLLLNQEDTILDTLFCSLFCGVLTIIPLSSPPVFSLLRNIFIYLGKTTAAVSLAKHYDAALLSIDTVVMEAISSGSTPAGQDARRLCKEATQRFLEEQRAMAGEEGGDKKQPGLSVEALTAHTQGTGRFS